MKLRYAFEELNIHRIMANYVLSNDRSKNVLEKHVLSGGIIASIFRHKCTCEMGY